METKDKFITHEQAKVQFDSIKQPTPTTTTTIAVGGTAYIGTKNESFTISLSMPTSGNAAEYHFFFVAGGDGVSFALADGSQIKWNADISTTSGNTYEVDIYYINGVFYGVFAEFEA